MKSHFAYCVLNYLFLESVLILNFGVKCETKSEITSEKNKVANKVQKLSWTTREITSEIMNIKTKIFKNGQLTFSI